MKTFTIVDLGKLELKTLNMLADRELHKNTFIEADTVRGLKQLVSMKLAVDWGAYSAITVAGARLLQRPMVMTWMVSNMLNLRGGHARILLHAWYYGFVGAELDMVQYGLLESVRPDGHSFALTEDGVLFTWEMIRIFQRPESMGLRSEHGDLMMAYPALVPLEDRRVVVPSPSGSVDFYASETEKQE